MEKFKCDCWHFNAPITFLFKMHLEGAEMEMFVLDIEWICLLAPCSQWHRLNCYFFSPQTHNSSSFKLDRNKIHLAWTGPPVVLWAPFDSVIGLWSLVSEARSAAFLSVVLAWPGGQRPRWPAGRVMHGSQGGQRAPWRAFLQHSPWQVLPGLPGI